MPENVLLDPGPAIRKKVKIPGVGALSPDFLVLTIGKLLDVAVSVISIRIFTTILQKEQVGIVYLILSLVSFFSLFGISPVGLYINRKVNSWISNGSVFAHLKMYNVYIGVLAGLSLPICFFAKAVTGTTSNSMPLWSTMLVISLSIYVTTWNSTIIPLFNILGRRTAFVVFSFLTSAANLGFSAGLSLTFEKSAFFWILGQIAAQSIVTLLALWHLRKTHREEPLRGYYRQIRRPDIKIFMLFILPLAVTSLCYWAQTQSYRILVERFIGLEYLALLGVGFGLSSRIATLVESLIQQYFYPAYLKQISTDSKTDRNSAWITIAGNTIPVYLSVTIFISFVAPFLTKILIGPEFQNAAKFIVFGTWIEFFRMTTSVFANVAHSEMKTSYLIVPNVTGGVLSIGGVYLTTRFPHNDLSIPFLLVGCGLVTTLVTVGYMKKLLPIALNYQKLVWAVFLSAPFVFGFLLKGYATMLGSFVILGALGIYFLGMQYVLFLRFRPQKSSRGG